MSNNIPQRIKSLLTEWKIGPTGFYGDHSLFPILQDAIKEKFYQEIHNEIIKANEEIIKQKNHYEQFGLSHIAIVIAYNTLLEKPIQYYTREHYPYLLMNHAYSYNAFVIPLEDHMVKINESKDKMENKVAYFQGTEEPTPKKKKYKSEPALVNQPRFKEPFYRNYDLYETEGVDGKAKHGPGVGWHDMGKYKSIKEFLAAKRKKLKGKYKSDDSWKQDDGSLSKTKKANFRMKLFNCLIKQGMDFPSDEYSDPTIGDPINDNPVGKASPGGFLDKYLPEDDFESKSPDKLDFGRDYVSKEPEADPDILKELEQKYLAPAESPMLGLPDGIEPPEDKDADFTVNDINPYYGTTDLGNGATYDKIR